jgi:DnaJ-domain-containing protein 1
MGQILKRLSRIAKSYINDKENLSDSIFNSDDTELKRAIEELDIEYKNNSKQTQSENLHNATETVMSEVHAYNILGIPRNSSDIKIKSAYKEKLRQYHPDKVAALGDELKMLAEKKTREINLAFEFLKKLKGFN